MRHRLLPRHLSAAFWFASLVLVVLLAARIRGEGASFLGIADASENVVSSETSAEVVGVWATPGQKVVAGDTLMRLRRPDLEARIGDISRQLQGAMGSATTTNLDVDRRASQLRSELDSRRTAILGQIKSLEEERGRNRELVSSLKVGAVPGEVDSANDPMLLRIQGLRRQLAAEEQGTADQLEVLRGGGGDQKKLARDMQAVLTKELALLQAEKEKLLLRAPIDGVVGSVNVRTGEKIAPFAPMLTISPRNPTLVRAYIHEKVYGDAAVGDSVEVRSSGARSGAVRGRVVGVGTRIVEFPLRLRKMPQVAVWGREVVVRIPASNPFLLGEMVTVHRLPGKTAP